MTPPAGTGPVRRGHSHVALDGNVVAGPWVLPLDLAAGPVLGGQRWASGSWPVPALTHVVANLLVVL